MESSFDSKKRGKTLWIKRKVYLKYQRLPAH